MSEPKELQDEEKEALISIYEGDDCFKEVTPTDYNYKYGVDDDSKSFLLEIRWTENYPNEIPQINLDAFYNRNIPQSFKTTVLALVTEEANNWIGCGMTYTLFECIKEKLSELMVELSEALETQNAEHTEMKLKNMKLEPAVIKTADVTKVKENKEQLTKAQKRRQWEKTNHKGEKPRGWNWVDLVKHLSQTGYKEEEELVIGQTAPAIAT